MEASKGELVPGGLAMIYGVKRTPSNNGLIVTTVRLAARGETSPSGRKYNDIGGWLCEGDGVVSHRGDKGHAYFLPSNLMPIKPEPDPLATEHEQCQHA